MQDEYAKACSIVCDILMLKFHGIFISLYKSASHVSCETTCDTPTCNLDKNSFDIYLQ